MPKKDNPVKRIAELHKEIQKHNDLYYKDNTPKISDKEFDLLVKELQSLEKANPSLATETSPTAQVGSDLSPQFSKFKHKVPVLSLENTYNETELSEWLEKTGLEELYSLEWKIDGASILLYLSLIHI